MSDVAPLDARGDDDGPLSADFVLPEHTADHDPLDPTPLPEDESDEQ